MGNPQTATVFVVDDDPGIRKSMSILLESNELSCEVFASAVEFLEAYKPDRAGCLVVDLSMPDVNGIDLIQRIREKAWDIPILIVSGTGTIPLVVEGMKLGAIDMLEKPADPTVLIDKIRKALEIDRQQRAQAMDTAPIHEKFATLTPREKELLSILIRGLSSKQVARELGISVKTVENHRGRLLQKMNALNVADLTRMAMIIGVKQTPAPPAD